MKHTMLKCLSLIMALATIVSVCALPALAATECNHYKYVEQWGEPVGVQEATCTEPGGTIYNCPNCHKDFVDCREGKVTLPLDHVPVVKERVEPVGSTPGYITYKCDRCGIDLPDETEDIPATECKICVNFEMVPGTNTATCEEGGTATMKCKDCKKEYTNVPTNALGHTWNNGVITTPAQCGQAGVITFTCVVCQDTKEDAAQAPSSEHRWEWLEAVAPTCEDPGNEQGYQCVFCDAAHPTDYATPIGELTHNWADKTDADHVNVALGCQDAVNWQQCDRCQEWRDSDTRTALEDPNGNHYTAFTVTVDGDTTYKVINTTVLTVVRQADCLLGGKTALVKCEICGFGGTDGVAIGTVAPHDWEVTQATCTSYGFKSCANGCGMTIGYLNADGTTNDEFAKVPHTVPTTGKIHKDASCTENERYEYNCDVCSALIKEDIEGGDPFTGHDRDIITREESTCKKKGHTAGLSACANGCGEPSTSVELPLAEHQWQLQQQLAATCNQYARVADKCAVCGIEENVTNQDVAGGYNANAHVFDEELTVTTPASCATNGKHVKTCTICARNDIEVVIPKTYHSFEVQPTEGTTPAGLKGNFFTVPATCQADGYKVYRCTNENCDLETDTFYTTNKIQKGALFFVKGDAVTVIVNQLNTTRYHYYTVDFTYDATSGFALSYGVHDLASNGTGSYYSGYAIGANGMASCTQVTTYWYTCQYCTNGYTAVYEDNFGPSGQHKNGAAITNADIACGVEGMLGRVVCERCNNPTTEGTSHVGTHEFDKTGVHAADYFGFTAPTCLAGGWTEKGYCTKSCCADIKVVEPTDAKGHAVGTVTFAKPATCTSVGWAQHFECTNDDCVYVLNLSAIANLEAGSDAFVTAAENVNNWSATVAASDAHLAVLTHAYSANGNVIAFDCGVDGYNIKKCPNCNDVAVGNGNYHYGYENHRYTGTVDAEGDNTVYVRVDGSYIECKDTIYWCVHQVGKYGATLEQCFEENQVHEAVAHTNAAGDAIIGFDDCSLFDETKDNTCKYCEEEFTLAKIHEDPSSKAEYEVSVNAANCVQFAHTVYTCTTCGLAKYTLQGNEYGDCVMDIEVTHAPTSWADYYEATSTCQFCGRTEEAVEQSLAEVYFSLDVANPYGGNAYVNGGKLSVTVNMEAYNSDIYSVLMNLTFDPTYLEFAGIEADADMFFAATTQANCDNNGMNYVRISGIAEHTGEGLAQNKKLQGKAALVTLNFEIKADAYGNASSLATAITFGDIVVGKYVDNAYTANSFDASATVANDDAIKVSTATYGGICATLPTNGGAYVVTIQKLFDLNGDGDMIQGDNIIGGTEDMAKIAALVLAADATYDARADLNQDGVLDNTDFILMQQFALGYISYLDLVKGNY